MTTQQTARDIVNSALTGKINGRTPRNFRVDTGNTACYTTGRTTTPIAQGGSPMQTMTATQVLAGLQPVQAEWLTKRALAETKITEGDVAKGATLVDLATRYASGYAGGFDFMVSMRDAAASYGRLTPRQAVGTLNCLLAEVRRNAKPAKALDIKVDPASLPQAGTYTVCIGSERRTLRIVPTKDRDGILMRVDYLYGQDNDEDYRGFAWVRESGQPWIWSAYKGDSLLARCLKALLTNDSNAITLESAHCNRCGRRLTVPTSLYAGMGPECAKHVHA